jgi:hypothetical protein
VALKPDILVEQCTIPFTATGPTSIAYTLQRTINPAKAFAFISNCSSIGKTDDGSYITDLAGKEWSCVIISLGANVLNVQRDTSRTVALEMHVTVVEYVGKTGGANEFIPRGEQALLLINQWEFSIALPASVVDDTKVVCFSGGYDPLTGHSSTTNWGSVAFMEQSDGAGNLRVKRGSIGSFLVVMIKYVEFTGSNWTIQREWDIFNSGTTNTHNLPTPVADWAKTFVYVQRCSVSGLTANTGVMVWPGATTGQYKSFYNVIHVPDATGDRFCATFIENPDIDVEWQDTIDGSLSSLSSGAQYNANTAGLIADRVDRCMSLLTLTTTGGLDPYEYACHGWSHLIRPHHTSPGDWQIHLRRGRNTGAGELSTQLIQFPVSDQETAIRSSSFYGERMRIGEQFTGERIRADSLVASRITPEIAFCVEGWKKERVT